MGRADSNPSIDALIVAHEGRVVEQPFLDDDDDDDETPHPSTFAQQSFEPQHVNISQPDLNDVSSSTSGHIAASGAHYRQDDAKSEMGEVLSKTTPLPSRSPSAKTSLKSIPLPAGINPTQRILSNVSAIPSSSSQTFHSPHCLNKFVLYETKRRFYIVGSNTSESMHRVLKIDRTSQEELSIVEDKTVYNEKQLKQLLRMLDDGNRTTGGFTRAGVFFGIAGVYIWFFMVIYGSNN